MHVSIDLFAGYPPLPWTPDTAPAPMSAEPPPTSLESLIAAVARNADRAAFATLFTRLGPRIKAYLQRGGISAPQAEDMTQDVFLAVWRKAGQFDPARAEAGAWIFAIARNVKIDALRRSRRPIVADDPSDEIPIPQADALVAAGEQARTLREAIAELPEEQIAILQLAFFEDLSHGEIEQRLGLPLGTIKSRLRLAMTKLRRALKDMS